MACTYFTDSLFVLQRRARGAGLLKEAERKDRLMAATYGLCIRGVVQFPEKRMVQVRRRERRVVCVCVCVC